MILRNFIELIEYNVIILIILDFNTVYSRTINVNFHFAEIIMLSLMILLFLLWRTYGLKLSFMKCFANYHLIYYMFAILLLVVIVEKEQLLNYTANFLIGLPLLSFLFVFYAEKRNVLGLIEKYTSIMTVFAAISLFFWLFGSQLHIIHPTARILAHWGSDYYYPSYFGLYVERQEEQFLFFDGLRNQGIFCEAPMYSFALIIAIAYNAFLKPELNSNNLFSKKFVKQGKCRQVILIIALLTTITTTGMIVLLLIATLSFLMTKPKVKFIVVLKWMISIILLSVALYIAISIFVMKSTSGSWLIRYDDLQAGFKGWLHSPIYGSGYGTYAGIDPYRSAFRFNGGRRPSFSNSLMLVLAQGGIIYFMMYFIPVVKVIKAALADSDFKYLSFLIVFCIEFTFTSITDTMLLLLLIAMFYGVSIEKTKFGNCNNDAFVKEYG